MANEVGKCTPLYSIFNAMMMEGLCYGIVDPLVNIYDQCVVLCTKTICKDLDHVWTFDIIFFFIVQNDIKLLASKLDFLKVKQDP